MTAAASWNDAEDQALQGLPLLAQLLYLRGLRLAMDYATGMVGAPPYGVSWRTLAYQLYVEPARGRSEYGQPTQKSLRFAVGLLARAGLVEVRSGDRELLFFLPLADRDDSAQTNRGRRRADVGQINRGTSEASHGEGSDAVLGQTWGRRGADQPGQDSGIRYPEEEDPPSPARERGGKTAKARGARLTHTDLPEDWRSWCEQERPDLDASSVWAQFADYWVAAPGAKGCKADWLATWRNWVRRERQQGGSALAVRQGRAQAVAERNHRAGEDFICDAATPVAGSVIDGKFRRCN